MNALVSRLPHVRDRVGQPPELSVETLALLASFFFTVFCSNAFWRRLVALGVFDSDGGWLTVVSLLAAMSALNMVLLCLLSTRATIKPLLTVLLLVTALVVHYMDQYRVYFDADMVRNVLHTDRREAGELISTALIVPMLLYGVFPALFVWRVKLKRRRLRRALTVRFICLLGAILVAAAAMLASFQGISALMRNHRELRYLIAPGNYLVSLATVALDRFDTFDSPRQPLGTDARVAGRSALAKPRLLVLVVGETVRAQNWGLNGYARQTTPELARLDVINFANVTACGSSTEVSLPCMFSPYGRANYDRNRIKNHQSLLHVLEHAGIDTLWRDNQSGCKGVCDGLAFESTTNANDAELCDSERCLDEILLHGLRQRIDARPGDQVVVLHSIGNHGPGYFLRYPQRMERFTPTCQTVQLGQCSREQIVNAYDNAVLYADHVIARAIGMLRANDRYDSALIYVSDHGESLGENGLYLHGIPYAIAPDTQLRVPMVMWLSPGLVEQLGLNMSCLQHVAAEPARHDNLFHSVLGLMQVHTRAYDRERDLFATCLNDRAAQASIDPKPAPELPLARSDEILSRGAPSS